MAIDNIGNGVSVSFFLYQTFLVYYFLLNKLNSVLQLKLLLKLSYKTILLYIGSDGLIINIYNINLD